jgi:hypothetical protein
VELPDGAESDATFHVPINEWGVVGWIHHRLDLKNVDNRPTRQKIRPRIPPRNPKRQDCKSYPNKIFRKLQIKNNRRKRLRIRRAEIRQLRIRLRTDQIESNDFSVGIELCELAGAGDMLHVVWEFAVVVWVLGEALEVDGQDGRFTDR